MKFDSISSIVYHAVNTDLSSRKFASLESALQVKPYFIVKETSGVWYNYEYTNQRIELDIYNNAGKLISEIDENGWVLCSIGTIQNYYYQETDLYAKITGPDQCQTELKCYGTGFGGVIRGVSVMREMARFENIEHYLIFKENEKLESQIKKLSAEIQTMKAQNQSI